MALFVRVVEAGSFSKAAAREGMPVSSVSRKIADLEKALGVRLLERSTRQLRMTEIGQGYFESCRRGLTEFEAADSLVTQRQAEISGRLRISIPPSMSDLAIVPLLGAFQERYPKVIVHCLVTERYIDYIADGIDLSFRVGQPNNRDSNIVASTVAVQRPRLLASPAYLARIEPVTRPQDVVPQRLCRRLAGSGERARHLGAARLPVQGGAAAGPAGGGTTQVAVCKRQDGRGVPQQ